MSDDDESGAPVRANRSGRHAHASPPPGSRCGRVPELGADIAATSVSGLSSGAFMAVQIEVAHSKDIKGAGIVAGGPYACAETEASRLVPFWPSAVLQNAQQALNQCMQTTSGTPRRQELAKRAEELAKDDKIDPLAGLTDDNVYLFSGNEDQTVTRPVVEAAAAFLKDAGVKETNLTLVEKEGGHAFITAQGGAACGITATPYVTDCDYDQALAILAWIYGPLAAPLTKPEGQFILFDQRPFSDPGDGFADQGVVYVPAELHREARLPRPYSAPWLRAVARDGGRRLHQAVGLRRDRRHKSAYHPVPPDEADLGDKPAGLWDWWAIPTSTISARTRRRSKRSGPWSSSSPQGREG